jgi:hypothetical protein
MRTHQSLAVGKYENSILIVHHKATIYYRDKIYRLLPINLLLRLVPREGWLVVALGQTERCHDRPDGP